MNKEAWTTKQKRTALYLARAGIPHAKISEIVGKSKNAVQYFLLKQAKAGRLTRRSAPPASATLCWDCAHAVPNPATGAGCPWSMRFEPVEGWAAELRTLKNYAEANKPREDVSYIVTACPLFREG